MSAKRKDRVIGVYKHAKGWEIKYVDGGKAKSRYRRNRDAAHRLKAALSDQLQTSGKAPVARKKAKARPKTKAKSGKAPTAPVKLEADGSTADHWRNLLWRMAGEVAKDNTDEDAQRALRAIAGAAGAAKAYLDISELEKGLIIEQQWREDIQKARATDSEESVAVGVNNRIKDAAS